MPTSRGRQTAGNRPDLTRGVGDHGPVSHLRIDAGQSLSSERDNPHSAIITHGIWRGKCGSDPRLIAEVIRRRAPGATRVVFETGPLSVWFSHALTAEGLPAICIDARHAKA